jgi:glycosyltransferase involved in cell wall biosynthesis
LPHRILFVNTAGAIGGAERSLLGLIGGLDTSRFEPTAVLFRDGPLTRELERIGVPTTVVPVDGSVHRLSLKGTQSSLAGSAVAALRSMHVVVSLARTIRRRRVSLVHTNGLKAHLIAGAAGRLARARVLWHLRDIVGDSAWENRTLAIGSRFADRIIANSDATSRAVAGRARCPIATVHNGVDTRRFHPGVDGSRFRHDLGINDGSPLIAMVGMFAPWKGQDVFLRAAKQVAERCPSARFVLVGDEIYSTNGHGSYAARLHALASELELEPRVLFAGYRDDMPQVMASIDLLVHASVQAEPFGRVLIEAMAAGKPVIATRAGGVTEIVVDGETGTLVPPGNAEALAGAMVSAIELSPEGRRRLGRKGRARVEERFSLQRHVDAVTAIYASVLER